MEIAAVKMPLLGKSRLLSGPFFILVLLASGVVAFRLVQTYLITGLPYTDSFTQGVGDEWKAFGGTWQLVDGSMRNDSDERGAKLVAGSNRWRDYSLEADIMLLGRDGDAGLIARASDEEQGVDSYSGYYAGLRNLDNTLVIGRADHGWIEAHTQPLQQGVVPFHWYHLKIIVVGCEMAASAGDPALGTHIFVTMSEKDCVQTGRIGLRSYSSGGAWRNVRVLPASHEMLQDFQIHANKSAPATPRSVNNPPLLHSDDSPIESESQPPQNSTNSPVSQPISSLRLVSQVKPEMATVQGVVVLTSPALFVQDSTGGVAILNPQGPPLKVGDEIEVTGRPEPLDFSSILRDGRVRLLWTRTPIPPLSVTASQAATGAFDATFVELEGYLESKKESPGNTMVLDLRAGEQSFQAVMNRGRGDVVFRKLKQNSLLRLRGICAVNSEYTHNLSPFVLLLRSADDVDVLVGPPWWTAGHLAAIGAGLLILVLAAQVLYTRAEHWRLKAVLEERERLAHEMHDTIAQSFAGIGFQLQAIRNDLQDTDAKAHRQLDLASDLVRHSHDEARRSIATLRPESLESIGLLPALDSCARKMVDGGCVAVAISSHGNSRPMPIRTTDVLFKIGQEAIANVVRHASPTSLNISIRYEPNEVNLAIEDDGVGFTAGGALLGFGIGGMRKRADSISAVLQIKSIPGHGTRVAVTAPLPPHITFKTWPVYILQYLKERRSNANKWSRSYPSIYRR
jgi:signal transduction histidine kinase